jgi:hypothetical protein
MSKNDDSTNISSKWYSLGKLLDEAKMRRFECLLNATAEKDKKVINSILDIQNISKSSFPVLFVGKYCMGGMEGNI